MTFGTTRTLSGRAARVALIIAALAATAALTTACSKPAAEPAATEPAATSGSAAPAPATEAAGEAVTELKIEDTTEGKGDEAKPGDLVTVHYTGWLMDGTKFDSSLDRGQPFQFNLGAGMVIPGWDEGVKGMKVGGKRVLIIPSDMAYGPQGTPDGTIPPNAPLKFEVELLEVASGK